MDIRKFSVEETSILKLLGADQQPLIGDDGAPMTITVYGPGSRAYQRAQTAVANRMLEKVKRRGKSEQTTDERVRDQAEFLAACTKAFSANIECDGLEGEALFRAVYADVTLGFIVEQVVAYLGEWANFTKASTTS